MSQLGPIKAEDYNWDEVENNAFFFPDPSKLDALDEYMRDLKKQGDSVGAKVKVVAKNVENYRYFNLLVTGYQIFTKWAIFSALEVVVVMESI